MAMTLDELKAQNAAEAAKAVEVETETEAELETEEEVEEVTDEVESETETEEEGEAPEVEAWQLEDERGASEDSGERRFSDSDVAAAKHKLRAKLEKRHDSEIARLNAELEALKRSGTQSQAKPQAGMPKLEDFDFDDGQYQAAMQSWHLSQLQNASQTMQAQEEQKRQAAQLEAAVEGHYTRAAKLAEEHRIDPELYRSADLTVRQAIESVFPDTGDVITDTLIARLGEGSEKVMYSLGRNAAKRSILVSKLLEDRNGLAASMYLGELKAEVSAPAKRVTSAPKPAKRANGSSATGSSESALMKRYQKERDTQARFDIRREAKRKGIDVSNW